MITVGAKGTRMMLPVKPVKVLSAHPEMGASLRSRAFGTSVV